MTKKELDIQIISSRLTDFQTDCVLLLSQVTDEKEKADPSHFLKLLFTKPHCTYLVLPVTQANTSQNQNNTIFANQIQI